MSIRTTLAASPRSVLSILLLCTCIAAVAPSGAAQSTGDDLVHDQGLWFMAFGNGAFSRRDEKPGDWRWWMDAQVRALDDSDGYDQLLLRPGLGYAVADESTVWLGYAYINSDPPGSANFDENRIWQQFLWSTRFEPFGFQSRTRLEQRFVETGGDTGWRFRQFFKGAYRFDDHSPLGLAAYDELFFDLNDTDWGASSGFAQNRLFAGLSWKLDSKGRGVVEVGYLNQYLRNEGRSDRMNHILSINLLLGFN